MQRRSNQAGTTDFEANLNSDATTEHLHILGTLQRRGHKYMAEQSAKADAPRWTDPQQAQEVSLLVRTDLHA